MRKNWLRLGGIVLLATVISNGSCATTNQQIQQQAAERIGIAAAREPLPGQPVECSIDTPHAAITVGMEAIIALSAERGQLDKANARQRRCYRFNEGLR